MKNKLCGELDRAKAERKAKQEGGRPGAYRKEYADQARQLVMLGLNQGDIAEFFGVAESTLSSWKRRHPELKAALEKAKAQMGMKLVNTVYQLAVGECEHTDKRLEYDKGKGRLVEKVLVKRLPPEFAAAKFLLEKRFSEQFPDKQQLDINGQISIDDVLAAIRGKKEPQEGIN